MNNPKVEHKNLLIQYDLLQKEMLSIGKKSLHLLFDISPKIKSIEVRGWTPSFNDGEPCVHCQDENFRMNETFYRENYDFDGNELSKEENECPISLDKLELVSSIMISEPVVEFLKYEHGTDFLVKISLDSDKQLKMKFEHYSDDY